MVRELLDQNMKDNAMLLHKSVHRGNIYKKRVKPDTSRDRINFMDRNPGNTHDCHAAYSSAERNLDACSLRTGEELRNGRHRPMFCSNLVWALSSMRLINIVQNRKEACAY